jgi:hypothetical protein
VCAGVRGESARCGTAETQRWRAGAGNRGSPWPFLAAGRQKLASRCACAVCVCCPSSWAHGRRIGQECRRTPGADQMEMRTMHFCNSRLLLGSRAQPHPCRGIWEQAQSNRRLRACACTGPLNFLCFILLLLSPLYPCAPAIVPVFPCFCCRLLRACACRSSCTMSQGLRESKL